MEGGGVAVTPSSIQLDYYAKLNPEKVVEKPEKELRALEDEEQQAAGQ